jgi:hypothetical protein
MATETVIAAHVRQVDPPQFVAEDLDDLFDMVGQEWAGEQCDNCGNSLYTVRFDSANFEADKVKRHQAALAFYVECTPDKDLWERNGQEIPEGVGCGTQYRLRWYHENEVAF